MREEEASRAQAGAERSLVQKKLEYTHPMVQTCRAHEGRELPHSPGPHPPGLTCEPCWPSSGHNVTLMATKPFRLSAFLAALMHSVHTLAVDVWYHWSR